MRFLAHLMMAFALLAAPAVAQHGRESGAPERGKPPSPGSKIIELMKYPPIDWKVPQVGQEVRRAVLQNGIVVFLMEDRDLPLIHVEVRIRTGSLYESRTQHGVAAMTASVMRTGGTASMAPDALNRKLESMAAVIETGSGDEAATASLNVLARDLDEGLRLLAEVLMKPAFAADNVELARQQWQESLRRRNDTPESIKGREYHKLVYGDHPYGWELDWDVVKGIKREDLVAWHERFFAPSADAVGAAAVEGALTAATEWKRPNIMIAVSGDFNSEEMLAKIRATFGAWKPRKIQAKAAAAVREQPAGVFVVKKDVTQTHVLLGHLGVDRYNADRVPLEIMNYILGGGSFTSRVTEKIRNDEGLAYSVGTSMSVGQRDRGTFTGHIETKVETTHKAIALMLEEIKRMTAGDVTAKELDDARDAYLNSFIFSFDDAADTVSRLMRLEFAGMPTDYYQTYLAKVRAVTVADVARVAKQYLQPGRLTILVVGDPTKFDNKLDSFGPVKVVPLKSVE